MPVLEEVAAGGHAVVYRATHERSVAQLPSRPCAPTPWLSQDCGRFLREARILGRFAHPNLPQIHDVARSRGALFLVLECGGIDLQDALVWYPSWFWVCCAGDCRADGASVVACPRSGRAARRCQAIEPDPDASRSAKLIDFGVAIVPVGGARPAPRLATPATSPASRGGRSESLMRTIRCAGGGLASDAVRSPSRWGPLGGNVAPSPVPSALWGLLSRCLEEQPSRRYAEFSELIDTGLGLRSQRVRATRWSTFVVSSRCWSSLRLGRLRIGLVTAMTAAISGEIRVWQ